MKQTVDLVILESFTLNLAPNATFTAPPIDISRFELVSVQSIFDFSGGGTGTGVTRLFASNDGVNFSYLNTSQFSFGTTITNNVNELQRIGFKFLRFLVLQSSGTGGTIKVIAHCTIR
jgi:hypothetical protein